MKPAAELIFDLTLWMPDAWRAPHTKHGVGQVVLNMNETQREKLKMLKSEDLRNIRDDAVYV